MEEGKRRCGEKMRGEGSEEGVGFPMYAVLSASPWIREGEHFGNVVD
jgi:hypothetical protein